MNMIEWKIIEPCDDISALERKCAENTKKLGEIKAEYNDVQYWINQAIAVVYEQRLHDARKKPDTQRL